MRRPESARIRAADRKGEGRHYAPPRVAPRGPGDVVGPPEYRRPRLDEGVTTSSPSTGFRWPSRTPPSTSSVFGSLRRLQTSASRPVSCRVRAGRLQGNFHHLSQPLCAFPRPLDGHHHDRCGSTPYDQIVALFPRLSWTSWPLQRTQRSASTLERPLAGAPETTAIPTAAPFRPCRSARLRRFTPRDTLRDFSRSHSWGSYPSGSLPTPQG